MKGTIITLDTDGTETVNDIDGTPRFDLIASAIGQGALQVVPFFTEYIHQGRTVECVAFCDEDGKITGLPYNHPATDLWDKGLKSSGHGGLRAADGVLIDHLVGKIAIVFGDEAFMRAL